MEQIKIIEKRGPNYVLLEATGELTANTFTELQSKIFGLITDTNVVLDMAEVIQVDSSGLGVLMAVFNDAEEYKQSFYIMRPSNEVRKALESTGFIEYFPIIQSVTEAL
ncbi:MAG TPA: anti-sigma F factor antagonist [Treponema sp.]|nr:anti-sigma F factor antagonist [Treponema sp.]